MKKSLFKICFAIFAVVLLTAGLFACTPTDGTKLTGLTVQKNNVTVDEITIVTGEKINYSDYTVLVTVSDGSAIRETLSETMFYPEQLIELHALPVGSTMTLTPFYQSGGSVVQGLIAVHVKARDVVVKTYDLHFVLSEYPALSFESQYGITKITSLPEIHPSLQVYQKITWFRNIEDISTRVELPYEMTADMTVYGKVRDDRQYTVRFWKSKTAGNEYKDQIGKDVSNIGFGEKVFLPTDGVDIEGKTFLEWRKVKSNGQSEALTTYPASDESGKRYFQINDEAATYPAVQVVNVYAVYAVKEYKVWFYYEDEQGTGHELKMNGDTNLFSVQHGCVLSLSFVFSNTGMTMTLPSTPPKQLGEGYEGAWHVNGNRLGTNQTSSLRGDTTVTVKYTKLKFNVTFYRANGNMISTISDKEYGSKIFSSDFPSLGMEAGYSFAWDTVCPSEGITVTSNLAVREVKTKNPYRHVLYVENRDGTVLLSETTLFDDEFLLLSLANIIEKLGDAYQPYYDYGWYGSETANPETDAPIVGVQRQAANEMSFYLKYADMRRYTVNYFMQKGADGAVAVEKVSSLTVKFAANAGFDSIVVAGWKASSLYKKEDMQKISDTLSFVPSALFAGEIRDYAVDVVVRYERELYTVQLFAPDFTTMAMALYKTVSSVPYETLVGMLSEISEYDKTDRVVGAETYIFYGWANANDEIVSQASEKIKANTDLYAKWVARSEGTYGVKYTLKSDGGTTYAEAVGYDGEVTELIIGSNYIDNNRTKYPVRAIGKILTPSKNRTVTKVTIPGSVTSFAAGAFVDFYEIKEFHVAESQTFSSVDGVLYSKDGTSLVAYPIKKEGAIVVPQSVITIESSAFVGCISNSITFEIGSILKNIDVDAFANCFYLTAVALPAGLQTIGAGAFSGSKQLFSVTYSGTELKNVGVGAFQNTAYHNSVSDGILYLGNIVIYAVGNFAGDSGTLTLGDNVTAIAAGAFAGTSLIGVRLGENSALRFVGDSAFAACSALEIFKINATGDVIDFGVGVFDNGNMRFKIAITGESQYQKYRTAYTDTDYFDDIVLAI